MNNINMRMLNINIIHDFIDRIGIGSFFCTNFI